MRLLWMLLPVLLSCAATQTVAGDGPPRPDPSLQPEPGGIDCSAAPTAPPANLGLDPFYEKYVWAGIPIVGSAKVRDEAFAVACDIVVHMLEDRPDVTAKLLEHGVRVGIIGASEVTTDMPEHRDLNEAFHTDEDWNERSRGVAATTERPLSSCGEENLLSLPEDTYKGENICVHEFGHTIWDMGVRLVPGGAEKDAELTAAYEAANRAGTFARTYAHENAAEYWAEGVQDWFDTNLESIPSNGVHNAINTRAELAAADPTLAHLLADVFGKDTWHPAPY